MEGIRLSTDQNVVDKDKKVFRMYRAGMITAIKGAIEISANNNIRITPEQFDEYAKKCGWVN